MFSTSSLTSGRVHLPGLLHHTQRQQEGQDRHLIINLKKDSDLNSLVPMLFCNHQSFLHGNALAVVICRNKRIFNRGCIPYMNPVITCFFINRKGTDRIFMPAIQFFMRTSFSIFNFLKYRLIFTALCPAASCTR